MTSIYKPLPRCNGMAVRYCLFWSNTFLVHCSQCVWGLSSCLLFWSLWKLSIWFAMSNECTTTRRTIRAIVVVVMAAHWEWRGFASGMWHFHQGACRFGISVTHQELDFKEVWGEAQRGCVTNHQGLECSFRDIFWGYFCGFPTVWPGHPQKFVKVFGGWYVATM